jgi:hypothetical protein
VQIRHNGFLRRLLGVRTSTPVCALLAETNQKFFRCYWWRSIARFWNKIRSANSPILRRVVESDVAFAREGDKECWVGELLAAMDALGMQEQARAIRDLEAVDVGALMTRVAETQEEEAWGAHAGIANVRQAALGANVGRRQAVYDKWFRYAAQKKTPHYLDMEGVSYRQVRQFARFRLGSHNLRVVREGWNNLAWDQRTCERCSSGEVDDEPHMLFECQAMHDAWEAYDDEDIEGLVTGAEGDMAKLMKCEDQDTLLRLVPFIAGCMDFVDSELVAEESEEDS